MSKTNAKIRAVLFGATGMIGGGVLNHCLQRDDIEAVLVVGRRNCGVTHPKLTEILHDDFTNYSKIEKELKGYNACFFALGISSMGMSEADYTRITYDYAVAAAETLVKLNPGMTFCFVTGMGTDDTLQSGQMWARVKGKTEVKLKTMPFKGVYIFRPGYIQPFEGQKNISWIYNVVAPLYPVWKRVFPKYVSTVDQIGAGMINAVRHGSEKQTLESADIVELAKRY